MTPRTLFLVFGTWLVVGIGPGQAGLYYSGERLADLPSAWRGFLTDLRALRGVAAATQASSLRQDYAKAAQALQEAAARRDLTAGEQADLGALLLRLGRTDEALGVLRDAARRHPADFAVATNLGTAWQVFGDLPKAAESLRIALELAPESARRLEELHLRLVRGRQRQPAGSQGLDDLFGVRIQDDQGNYTPGRLPPTERAKLPSDAVALTQQLALALPSDGRLLWQLGELAAAHGDLTNAAALLDLCVGEFGMTDPTLRAHRQALRAAIAEPAGRPPAGKEEQRATHALHAAGGIAFKSRKPLIPRPLDVRALPRIRKDAANEMPWRLLHDTQLDQRRFRPTFPAYLRELDGLRVTVLGYVQPLTDELDASAFLLVEAPVGCWYCEMPEVTGLVFVELPEGKRTRFTRDLVKVSGTLRLNTTDPEEFLFAVADATVGEPD